MNTTDWIKIILICVFIYLSFNHIWYGIGLITGIVVGIGIEKNEEETNKGTGSVS